MKKTILIAITAIALMSFKLIADYNTAIVSDQMGIKIFCYSKPTAKYDFLGNVKVKGMVSNTKGEHMVELLLENAKKEYPNCDGIIIGSDFFKAEVIKFKE